MHRLFNNLHILYIAHCEQNQIDLSETLCRRELAIYGESDPVSTSNCWHRASFMVCIDSSKAICVIFYVMQSYISKFQNYYLVMTFMLKNYLDSFEQGNFIHT